MTKSVDRLSAWLLTRYGVGQVGAQVFRDTPAVLLPVFMTTLLGVPAWLAGAAILAPKLWIVIADPLMGSWSDRRKSTWGRLPFLAVGAVGAMVGFFLLFTPPRFSRPGSAALYVSVVYFLASTAFSAYTVPYLALASELGGDTQERTRIMSFRVIFTIVGVVLGVGVAQPAVGWFGGGQAGWSHMALVMAAVCALAMLVPVVGLWGRRLAASEGPPGSLMVQLRAVGGNRPFCVLIATYLLQAIGQAVNYSVIGLVFLFVFGNVALLLPFVLLMACGTLICQPFWLWFAGRFGKVNAYFLSTIVWIGITATWFFVRPGGPVVAVLPIVGPVTSENLWVLVRAVFIGFFNTGFILMGLSMLADTIALDRIRYGRSSEGVFSGLFSAVEKVSFAVGPAIGGLVLSLSGFASSKGGAGAQTPQALRGILLNYSLIPCAIFAVSLLVLRLYRLDPQDLDE